MGYWIKVPQIQADYLQFGVCGKIKDLEKNNSSAKEIEVFCETYIISINMTIGHLYSQEENQAVQYLIENLALIS